MPIWARAIVIPLTVGWLALGWWLMLSAIWKWSKRRSGHDGRGTSR